MNDRLHGHERIALSFSGGKDSLACLQMFKHDLDRLTLYHVDTGDQLPEMQESVARIEAKAPHFVRIKTDPQAWMVEHGLPSDLVPYSSHWVGMAAGQARRVRIMHRYDCCYANLMWPLFQRVRDDGCTLLIRGAKLCDMPQLPAQDGDVVDGVELYYPLLDWTHQDVFEYLREQRVPIPRVYKTVTNSPECARCPAWWGEKRAEYLKRHHPDLWREYDARLRLVMGEVAPSMALLWQEVSSGL